MESCFIAKIYTTPNGRKRTSKWFIKLLHLHLLQAGHRPEMVISIKLVAFVADPLHEQERVEPLEYLAFADHRRRVCGGRGTGLTSKRPLGKFGPSFVSSVNPWYAACRDRGLVRSRLLSLIFVKTEQEEEQSESIRNCI